ncbi:LysE/ArgO family amino acid transporter [Nocardioides panacisoli]|uniref:LysE/ArgO family amino acid transporter n=1 Tax=Nocardioides panacisoli TaxID=627624 RepID=A0ABP7IYA8_9ACTN
MITAAAAGLATGLTLIVAIGAQNAFVLRQGLARRHVGAVVAVCALSDVVLIGAGVVGIGTIVERAPVVLTVLRWLGVAFLAAYGVRSLLSARRADGLEAASRGASTRVSAIATAAALTYLNPHVYLDTVLLLGSVANQHGVDGRWWFAVGAATGSVIWFSGLGYGARAAHGLLARPRAWQVLDLAIGVGMLCFAGGLAIG